MNDLHDFFHQPRALMLAVSMVILVIWVLSWEEVSTPEPKNRNQSTLAIDYKNRTRQFNFDSLIFKMDTYYRLAIDDATKQELSHKEISDMLFGFHQERRRLYNYLESLKKNKNNGVSQRKERSLRHYLQSTESCINDLKKRLKNKPKAFTKN